MVHTNDAFTHVYISQDTFEYKSNTCVLEKSLLHVQIKFIDIYLVADLMDEFYKPAVSECQKYIRKCQVTGQTECKGDFLVMNQKPDGHV